MSMGATRRIPMKTILRYTLSLCLMSGISLVPALRAADNSSVALITKIVQVVDRKSAEQDWKKAQTSDVLSSGDGVRTGQRSLAIVKFIDNSIVRVRPQSEVTILGETPAPGTLSKNIRLLKGAFGFEVKKQHA